MNAYIDSSALVKLVVLEPETDALLSWIAANDPVFYSADLLRTEALRAARQVGGETVAAAREQLDAVNLIALSTDTFVRAGELDPTNMRSLDALHLAVALELGDDLDVFIAYDTRLSEAAATYGLTIVAPA